MVNMSELLTKKTERTCRSFTGKEAKEGQGGNVASLVLLLSSNQ
jgi:hypothetical protein